MTTPSFFLFVSHPGQDRSAALQIVDELERRGVCCWIAPRDVSPGKSSDDEIADAIKTCRAMLLILSDRCDDKDYVGRATALACNSGKVIIPFRIEEAGPKSGSSVRLSDLLWIDAFVSRERAIDEAMHARQPSRLQPAAAGPIAIQLDSDTAPALAHSHSVSPQNAEPASEAPPVSSKIPSSRARDPGQAKSVLEAAIRPTSSRSRKRLLFGGAIACAAAMLAIVLLRPRPIPSLQRADPPVQQVAAESAEDLDRLRTAMDGCETDAKKDVGTLRFLIIPLAPVQKDWREKSIAAVGNAFLLTSSDALGGLEDGTLQIYPGQYDFRVIDQGTNVIYKWKLSDGVANFTIADSGWVTQFKVQFLTRKNAADDQWGNSFERPNGKCYWVSAVIDS